MKIGTPVWAFVGEWRKGEVVGEHPVGGGVASAYEVRLLGEFSRYHSVSSVSGCFPRLEDRQEAFLRLLAEMRRLERA